MSNVSRRDLNGAESTRVELPVSVCFQHTHAAKLAARHGVLAQPLGASVDANAVTALDFQFQARSTSFEPPALSGGTTPSSIWGCTPKATNGLHVHASFTLRSFSHRTRLFESLSAAPRTRRHTVVGQVSPRAALLQWMCSHGGYAWLCSAYRCSCRR